MNAGVTEKKSLFNVNEKNGNAERNRDIIDIMRKRQEEHQRFRTNYCSANEAIERMSND